MSNAQVNYVVHLFAAADKWWHPDFWTGLRRNQLTWRDEVDQHETGLILGWLHFFLSTERFIKPYLVEPDVCHPEDMLSSLSQQHHVWLCGKLLNCLTLHLSLKPFLSCWWMTGIKVLTLSSWGPIQPHQHQSFWQCDPSADKSWKFSLRCCLWLLQIDSRPFCRCAEDRKTQKVFLYFMCQKKKSYMASAPLSSRELKCDEIAPNV